MKRKLSIFATLIIMATAIAVFADVTFDTTDGTGFVGKGDVQLLYGWNNAALQTNASGVSFYYSTTATYTGVCKWYTGQETKRKEHTKTKTVTAGVNSAITVDTRKNSQGQVTGFKLSGFSTEPTVTSDIPEVGSVCIGEGTDLGTWESVTQVGEAEGGLYVSYGGTNYLL